MKINMYLLFFLIVLIPITYIFAKKIERHRLIAEMLYQQGILSLQNGEIEKRNRAVVLQAMLFEINSTPNWLKVFAKPKYNPSQDEITAISDMIFRAFVSSGQESANPNYHSLGGIVDQLENSYTIRR